MQPRTAIAAAAQFSAKIGPQAPRRPFGAISEAAALFSAAGYQRNPTIRGCVREACDPEVCVREVYDPEAYDRDGLRTA